MGKPLPGVIHRARKWLGNQIIQAQLDRNPALAVEAYQEAAEKPQTETEQILLNQSGYALNGTLGSTGLVIAYSRDRSTHVMKILSDKEVVRATSFLASVKADMLSGEYCRFVTTFDLESVSSSVRATTAMFMPYYPTTFETLTWVGAEQYTAIVTESFAALDYLHMKGFAYMDMKPSNVCFAADGHLVLIDLGSIAKFGDRSESTVVYLPADMLPPPVDRVVSNKFPASPKQDWWMLAVSLLEKFDGLQVGVGALKTPQSGDIRSAVAALEDRFQCMFNWVDKLVY